MHKYLYNNQSYRILAAVHNANTQSLQIATTNK